MDSIVSFCLMGASDTLAQSKPDQFNARAKAVEALMRGNIWMTQPVIKQWKGQWQQDAI